MDIKKGQTVWVMWRTGIKETKVKSIGRKYIILEIDPRVKFDVNTLREINGCGVAYFIILDLEKYKEECYYNTLREKLRGFKWSIVEDKDLDKISNIIKDYY